MKTTDWLLEEAARRPMVAIATGIAAGTGCAFALDLPFLGAVLLLFLSWFILRKRLQRSGRPVPLPVLLFMAAFLLGGLRCLVATAPARWQASSMAGTEELLKGICITFPDESSPYSTKRSLIRRDEGGIILLESKGKAIPYGKRVEIPVRFLLPEGARNPGGYDEKERYAKEGVFLAAQTLGADLHGYDGARKDPFVLAGRAVREGIAAAYGSLLPAREAALMSGMLLGDTTGMDPDDEEDFRLAGLSHLTAVSGSNVAFILAPASLLATKGRLGRRSRAAVLALYLGFFGYVTGWEASVTRAILMSLVILLGTVLLRRSDSLSTLASAAAIMVFVQPTLFFDNGFRLSVLATLGLIGISPPLGRLFRRPFGSLRDSMGQRFLRSGLDLLAATTSAQLAVLPVSLPMSGNLSLAGLLSNLPVVPVAECVTLAGAALGLAGWVLSLLGMASSGLMGILRFAAVPLDGLLSFILDVAGAAANLSFLRFPVALRLVHPFFPSFCILLLGISFCRRDIRRNFFRASAGLACIALLFIGIRPLFEPDVTVVFADVGQGDLTLIVTKEGRSALIDGGPSKESTPGPGPAALLALFSYYGIDAPDIVLSTHPHADHAGGLIWLLSQRRCGTLAIASAATARKDPLSPQQTLPVSPYARDEIDLSGKMQDAARRSGTAVKVVAARDRMELGSDCVMTVLHPFREAGQVEDAEDDPNADSMVVRVDCPGFSCLITGDADDGTEKRMLTEGILLDVDLLRVAHHGSASSTGSGFLVATSPRLAVISVGPNLYGHPSQKALDRIDETGCEILRTDRSGAVVVEIRKGGTRFRTWNGGREIGEIG